MNNGVFGGVRRSVKCSSQSTPPIGGRGYYTGYLLINELFCVLVATLKNWIWKKIGKNKLRR